MRYGVICDGCSYEDELVMPWQEWSEKKIGECPKCGNPMHRLWKDAAKLNDPSSQNFGFTTNNMGDGPQYVGSYQELKRKLKARGLHLAEPDRELTYAGKHAKDRISREAAYIAKHSKGTYGNESTPL